MNCNHALTALTRSLFAAFFLAAAGASAVFAGPSADSAVSSSFSEDRIKAVSVPEVTLVEPSADKAASSFTSFPSFAFSDESNLSAHLVKAISSSRKSVDVCIYSFTLNEVAAELLNAKNRGVALRVIIDQHHVFAKDRDRQVQRLIDAGVNLRTLRGTWTFGVNHNKIGIYDKTLVTAGSFNWSDNAAYNNHENMMLSRKAAVVVGYSAYFDYMWSAARPFSSGPVGELPTGYFSAPPVGPTALTFGGQKFPEYSFSPAGGTRENILKAIGAARKSISVASFTFSDKQFALALSQAVSRGVKVKVLTDKATAKTRGFVSWLVRNGVEVRLGKGRSGGSMHHKFAIFDGKLLETGSHNWTGNAEVNDFENVFYTTTQAYIDGYQRKFDQLYSSAAVPDLSALPAPEDMNSNSAESFSKSLPDGIALSDEEVD